MAKRPLLISAPPKLLTAASGLARASKIDLLFSAIGKQAMKINWAMVGPSLQALTVGAGVIAAGVTVMNKQGDLEVSINKDLAAIGTKVDETNNRVDKLYDLLVYSQVAIGGRP